MTSTYLESDFVVMSCFNQKKYQSTQSSVFLVHHSKVKCSYRNGFEYLTDSTSNLSILPIFHVSVENGFNAIKFYNVLAVDQDPYYIVLPRSLTCLLRMKYSPDAAES